MDRLWWILKIKKYSPHLVGEVSNLAGVECISNSEIHYGSLFRSINFRNK